MKTHQKVCVGTHQWPLILKQPQSVRTCTTCICIDFLFSSSISRKTPSKKKAQVKSIAEWEVLKEEETEG